VLPIFSRFGGLRCAERLISAFLLVHTAYSSGCIWVDHTSVRAAEAMALRVFTVGTSNQHGSSFRLQMISTQSLNVIHLNREDGSFTTSGISSYRVQMRWRNSSSLWCRLIVHTQKAASVLTRSLYPPKIIDTRRNAYHARKFCRSACMAWLACFFFLSFFAMVILVQKRSVHILFPRVMHERKFSICIFFW
jgi:hypothetical protein